MLIAPPSAHHESIVDRHTPDLIDADSAEARRPFRRTPAHASPSRWACTRPAGRIQRWSCPRSLSLARSKVLGPSAAAVALDIDEFREAACGQLVADFQHVDAPVYGWLANGKTAGSPYSSFRPFDETAVAQTTTAFWIEAGHGPRLGLRDRTRFGDLDHVAHLVFIVLVVRVVLARARDDLAVELVLGAPLDLDGNGLRALVAHDLADQRAGVLGTWASATGAAAPVCCSLISSLLSSSGRARSLRERCRDACCPAGCDWRGSGSPSACAGRSAPSTSRRFPFWRPSTSFARSSDAFMNVLLTRRPGALRRCTSAATWLRPDVKASRASTSSTPLIS